MSSYGPSIWDKTHPYPEHKGKMHQKHSVASRDTSTQSGYLKQRLSEDDSDAVNMSDSKLGGGVRDFTKS